MFSQARLGHDKAFEVMPHMFIRDVILFGMTQCNVAEVTFEEEWRRYPETGYALNKESDMIVRVLEGSIFLQSGKTDHANSLSKGYVAGIPWGEKYYWRQPLVGRQKTIIEIFSAPIWTKEQQLLFPE